MKYSAKRERERGERDSSKSGMRLMRIGDEWMNKTMQIVHIHVFRGVIHRETYSGNRREIYF